MRNPIVRVSPLNTRAPRNPRVRLSDRTLCAHTPSDPANSWTTYLLHCERAYARVVYTLCYTRCKRTSDSIIINIAFSFMKLLIFSLLSSPAIATVNHKVELNKLCRTHASTLVAERKSAYLRELKDRDRDNYVVV